MKSLIALFFLALVVGLRAQDIPETPLRSAITEVRVYLNRAGITEEASLPLKSGDHLLVFSGLSRTVQPQSIQVTGKGEGILQSVTYRTNYLSRTPKTPRMLQIEDSLKKFEASLEEEANAIFVLSKEEELILKNSELGGNETGFSAEELQRLSQFYARRLTEIKALQLRIRRSVAELNAQKTLLAQELAEINRYRNEPTQEVLVAYRATQAGPVQLTLRYLVTGASWQPLYDLRAQSNRLAPIALSLKANVVNTSGVDWKRVRLILSTANPAVGGTPPSLSIRYVDRYEPEAQLYDRSYGAPAAASGKAEKYADDASDSEEFGGQEPEPAPEAQTAASYTTSQEYALSVEYAIAIPYDVSTDGKPRRVDVKDYELKATYQHYAAPGYEPHAFLQAAIGGWEDFNLLPGPANVYFDGAFLTTTHLNPGTTQDTLRVGLGRDPQIVVSRTKIQDLTSRKIIGTNTRDTYGYSIEVRNAKSEPISLVIEDQIPVSKNKDIVVTLTEGHLSTYTASNGRLRWTVTLLPGTTQKFSFQYEVRYPKDWQLEGL